MRWLHLRRKMNEFYLPILIRSNGRSEFAAPAGVLSPESLLSGI